MTKEEQKLIIRQTSEFIEDRYDDIVKDCIGFIIHYNGNDFVRDFMTSQYDDYFQQFSLKYHQTSTTQDYAYEVLKKKLGYTVKNIAEE